MRLLTVFIALYLMTSESLIAGEKSKRKDIANYIGCYELMLSPWLPDMNLGNDEIYITLPKKIELQRQQGKSGFEKGKLLLRPVSGTQGSIHQISWWERKKNELYLVWTTGRSGLTMHLHPSGSDLRGYAESFWDFSRATQRSEVLARSISCISPRSSD